MTAKLPAFQFYPGDWMQDTRCLSLASKGAWIDLLCAMWRSQTRGQLFLPIVGYARIISSTVDQTEAVIKELTDMQICDCETNGNGIVTLINRRMCREEKERIATRLRVQKFRNTEEKRLCNANVTPPSSSSSPNIIKNKDLNLDVTLQKQPPIQPPNQVKRWYKNEQGNYVCYQCTKSFMAYQKLQDHLATHKGT